MEEILASLSKIHDLRVISRTSVEPFRGTNKLASEIAKKLKVDYIVEGSGQKYGSTFRLRVQLIDASRDKHIWTESYEQEIIEVKDIFRIQSQIAKSIATELQTVMTPEEKQLIEKIPETNLTAYDFYWRGREEYGKYEIYKGNLEAATKAEVFYRRALEYDSTFAQAYTGLAAIYWDKYYLKEYFLKDFMDSVRILCDIALSYDNQLAEAYTLKGKYYSETGNPERAIKEYDKALKLNPNDWIAYSGKAEFYYEIDWINYIKYLQEAVAINHGPELPALLLNIGYAYNSAGIPEKAMQYIQDKLKLDGDSADYFAELARYEFWLGNFDKSIEFGLNGYALDSTNATALVILGGNYAQVGQYEESLKYFNKWINRSKPLGDGWVKHNMHRVGYVYSQGGNKEAAKYFFNEQMNYCNRSIELNRKYAQMLYAYFDLAGIYAYGGERDKAYKNLRIFNKKPIMSSWMVSLIKTDHLFDSIRNEPEFQQIVRDVEAKYQAEHERVRKWLEEQVMLEKEL
jgi:TolB-like protein